MAVDRGSQWAIQDKNQFPALIGHSGTAGTAETRRVVVTSAGAVTTDSVEVTAFNGGSVAIGSASAVEITFTGTTQGVCIMADYDNAGTIYLGGSGVTNTGANAFAQLLAGDSISLDFNDGASPIYGRASASSQKAWKVALT